MNVFTGQNLQTRTIPIPKEFSGNARHCDANAVFLMLLRAVVVGWRFIDVLTLWTKTAGVVHLSYLVASYDSSTAADIRLDYVETVQSIKAPGTDVCL